MTTNRELLGCYDNYKKVYNKNIRFDTTHVETTDDCQKLASTKNQDGLYSKYFIYDGNRKACIRPVKNNFTPIIDDSSRKTVLNGDCFKSQKLYYLDSSKHKNNDERDLKMYTKKVDIIDDNIKELQKARQVLKSKACNKKSHGDTSIEECIMAERELASSMAAKDHEKKINTIKDNMYKQLKDYSENSNINIDLLQSTNSSIISKKQILKTNLNEKNKINKTINELNFKIKDNNQLYNINKTFQNYLKYGVIFGIIILILGVGMSFVKG
tara:strand:- start:3955 stop:4764 length:810 start_codon:yes stop_codon:yes gene_type:complete